MRCMWSSKLPLRSSPSPCRHVDWLFRVCVHPGAGERHSLLCYTALCCARCCACQCFRAACCAVSLSNSSTMFSTNIIKPVQGGPTGIAANPARDFSPRLAHALLPIAGGGGGGCCRRRRCCRSRRSRCSRCCRSSRPAPLVAPLLCWRCRYWLPPHTCLPPMCCRQGLL